MNKKFSINLYYFFISFMAGLLFVYLDSPKPRIIVKYPTPYNTEKLTYKGLSDDCYKFKVNEIECTKDAIQQPIV